MTVRAIIGPSALTLIVAVYTIAAWSKDDQLRPLKDACAVGKPVVAPSYVLDRLPLPCDLRDAISSNATSGLRTGEQISIKRLDDGRLTVAYPTQYGGSADTPEELDLVAITARSPDPRSNIYIGYAATDNTITGPNRFWKLSFAKLGFSVPVGTPVAAQFVPK